jgi:PAS domain S-box-containing protein
MLALFGPWLLVGLSIVLLAVFAVGLEWHQETMRTVALVIGAIVMLAAVGLFYVQGTERRGVDRTLKSAQNRIANVVDSAMDAIVSMDEHQRIVLFNAAAEKVFGWKRRDVMGKPIEVLIPERLRAAHHGHIERFGSTGTTSRRMGDRTVLVGLRSSGEEFPIEASISQIREEGSRFYTVILRDVTERVLAEHALRQSKDELREMAAASHKVREQEKSRIARELHDELAQSLTSLKMDVMGLKDQLPQEQRPLAARLDTMAGMLDGMVTATRRISADLRPLILDDLGLVPAAEWLTQNFTQRSGVKCEFSVDPPELELQDPHATAIFRILQESLNNVARHAHATQVEATLDGTGREIVLRVRDDGTGFEAGAARKPQSFGLAGLRERVSLLDGELKVETAPGRGTLIEVRIPLVNAETSS